MRAGLLLVAAALGAGFIPLLTHLSQNPRWFGCYSTLYLGILLWHAFAIAACVAVAGRGSRRQAVLVSFARSFGSRIAVTLVLLTFAYLMWVYQRSGDTDIRNAAVLGLDTALLAWLAAAWHGNRTRLPLGRLALAALATLFALLVFDLGLMLSPWVARPLAEFRDQQLRHDSAQRLEEDGRFGYGTILRTDPDFGVIQAPDTEYETTVLSETGSEVQTVKLHTDALGYLNPDLDPTQPVDVAIVGDSFVACSWPQKLAEISGLKVAALAVPGYCPPQYSLIVRRQALALRPRQMIVCIYNNDAVESHFFIDWRNSGMDWFSYITQRWFFPQEPPTGRTRIRRDLRSVSRITTLVEFILVKRRMRQDGITENLLAYSDDRVTLNFDPNSFGWLSNRDHTDVHSGLRHLRIALQEIKDACDEAGVPLAVWILPSKELTYWQEFKQVIPPGAPIQNINWLYEQYSNVTRDLGIPSLDLTERFRRAAATSPEQLYWVTDLHWNPQGNAAMAAMARELLAGMNIFPTAAPNTAPTSATTSTATAAAR